MILKRFKVKVRKNVGNIRLFFEIVDKINKKFIFVMAGEKSRMLLCKVAKKGGIWLFHVMIRKKAAVS